MAAMGSSSRPGAVVVATTGVVATGAGVLWWRAAGGGEAPGMAQHAAVTVGASLLGGFVLWHGPGNRYRRVHLAVGLLFGSVVLAAGALSPPGLPAGVGQIAQAWSWLALPLLLPLSVMVIATFPDGLIDRFSRGQTTSGGQVPEGARRGALAAPSTSLPQPGPPRLQEWRARFPEWRGHHGQDLSLVPMVFDKRDEGLSRALVYRGWWLAGASLALHPPHRLPDFGPGRCRCGKDLAKWPPASVFRACRRRTTTGATRRVRTAVRGNVRHGGPERRRWGLTATLTEKCPVHSRPAPPLEGDSGT
jgi:hypothetical protein